MLWQCEWLPEVQIYPCSTKTLVHLYSGFMNATACFKSQVHEMESLMQDSNDNVKEAAGMLGFLDLGLGLTSMGVVLQLSQSILDLVLKIQISGHDTKQECSWPTSGCSVIEWCGEFYACGAQLQACHSTTLTWYRRNGRMALCKWRPIILCVILFLFLFLLPMPGSYSSGAGPFVVSSDSSIFIW